MLKGTSRRHWRTIPLITCQPVGTKFQSNLRAHHTPFLTPDAPNLCLSHTFKNKFWCGPFLNSIEFVTILLLFCVLVFWLRGMWEHSSPTRDWTCTSYIGRQSLNYWTAREVYHTHFNPLFMIWDGSSLLLALIMSGACLPCLFRMSKAEALYSHYRGVLGLSRVK